MVSPFRKSCGMHRYFIKYTYDNSTKTFVFHRFLATGLSFTALAQSFRMGLTTVANIVEETTAAIWKNLRTVYMPTPTVQTMQEVANGFYAKCQFPNVIGAIDGKHIRIQCPDNSGSDFYNYKQYFLLFYRR